jgi:hypothetical protein
MVTYGVVVNMLHAANLVGVVLLRILNNTHAVDPQVANIKLFRDPYSILNCLRQVSHQDTKFMLFNIQFVVLVADRGLRHRAKPHTGYHSRLNSKHE